MASKVVGATKGGIRAWLMPEINDIKLELESIKGDIKVLRADISRVEEKLTAEIQSTKESLNVVQRLAVLEAKVSELSKSETKI